MDDAFKLFRMTPFWVGPVVSFLVFAIFRWLMPYLTAPKPGELDVGIFLRQISVNLAWLPATVFLFVWIVAEVHKLGDRRLLNNQTGLESVREESWDQFERLVAEAYRRQGYLAEVVGSASGDGGVDVELRKPGEFALVQCKQWKAYKVGVSVVRELLGVVVSRNADKGIVITSGAFTEEAQAFARQSSRIELLAGKEAFALVRAGQRSMPAPIATQPAPPAAIPLEPACPSCGNAMVLRTARKGPTPGSQFWGCRQYPRCRGSRPYASRSC
jgi:restriction system protein